jgi:hypothetical protein
MLGAGVARTTGVGALKEIAGAVRIIGMGAGAARIIIAAPVLVAEARPRERIVSPIAPSALRISPSLALPPCDKVSRYVLPPFRTKGEGMKLGPGSAPKSDHFFFFAGFGL